MTSIDAHGRILDYLRVSITDRCNLRCVYCMPPEGIAPRRHTDILSFEQIVTVVVAASRAGFRKIRLTGGEPLVRRGIVELVRSIRAVPGIDEVTMTTNGLLLPQYAADLAAAGLSRVNISLDSMDQGRFIRLTRLGDLNAIWKGIAAAEAAGLTPLKLNVVLIRGINDDEVADFARLTFEHAWHIRFIEVMPLAGEPDWGPGMPRPGERFVRISEVRRSLADLGTLEAVPGPQGHGPARYYHLPGARGTIGFISAISEHFCGMCNRLRLTSDGWLRPCLFSDAGVPLKPALDAGAGPDGLAGLIRQAIGMKPAQRPILPTSSVAGRAMSAIGG